MRATARILAAPALLAAACAGNVHTLELELVKPDGSRSTHALTGETSWEWDSSGQAFASWPDLAEWGTTVDLGFLVNLFPLQPGTYATGGRLYIGADMGNDFRNAATATVTMHMERVTWTGNASYPFRQEGWLEGTTAQGHAFKGRFTTSSDDCTDKVVGNELCGVPNNYVDQGEQVWSIDTWLNGVDCPASLVEKYSGGTRLTVTPREARTEKVALPCLFTYANTNKQLCGASEDRVTYDGCAWSVTAWAQPGNDYLGVAPTFAVYAGTVGDGCVPKTCSITPQAFTHVSGARP